MISKFVNKFVMRPWVKLSVYEGMVEYSTVSQLCPYSVMANFLQPTHELRRREKLAEKMAAGRSLSLVFIGLVFNHSVEKT